MSNPQDIVTSVRYLLEVIRADLPIEGKHWRPPPDGAQLLVILTNALLAEESALYPTHPKRRRVSDAAVFGAIGRGPWSANTFQAVKRIMQAHDDVLLHYDLVQRVCDNADSPYHRDRTIADVRPVPAEFLEDLEKAANRLERLTSSPPAPERPATAADGTAQTARTIASVRTDKKREARDKWIYNQCWKMVPYKTIITQLNDISSSKGWEPIESVQGIRAAASRLATRLGWQPIPRRQDL
jgi:hypothetical protein